MTLSYLRTYAGVRTESAVLDDRASGVLPLEDVLGGRLIRGSAGNCMVADTAWSPGDRHGSHALEDLAITGFTRLAGLVRDTDVAHADMRKAVFLDTETTGLGLGTGTYVFLVGAGYLDGDGFAVRQFFLTDPGEEEPFLEALHEFLAKFSILVTFNGKAFDWPLLESRFVGHRSFRRPPLHDPMHVDLLHPARRLWKRRLESCALQSLEKHILGVSRETDDVPGWMIPSIYFRYVHSGDARALRGVFYHNLMDIMSLAGLALHLDRLLADPLGAGVSEPADLICLAAHFERSGETALAAECLEEALRRFPGEGDRQECLTRLGWLYKREQNWERALAAWDALVDGGGASALVGLVERAKYREHVEREYLDALEDVQNALSLLELDGSLSRMVERADLDHRRSRLMDRVLRQRRRGARS